MGSGASASATIAKQAKALQGRRYLKGMRPEKYFAEVVKLDFGETFEILGFTDEEAFELFAQYMQIDDDNSGEVSLDEFHKYLECSATKFSERVFTILDLDMSGFLDLREFIVGVWNYCTYDTPLVAKLVFDIFDIDRRGVLTMPEYDAILRMLYAVDEADPELMALLAINGDGDEDELSYKDFVKLVEENYQILQPAFELQRSMRRKLLSVKYWEKKTRQRKEMFAGYDQSDLNSWEAVEQIITQKHQERQAELARKREEVEERNRKELELMQENIKQRHEEQQLRKVRKLAELKDAKLPEEIAEEAAWTALKAARQAAEERFPEDKLEEAKAVRAALWGAFDAAVAATVAKAGALEDRGVYVAMEDDAQNKSDAWIATKQGAARFEFLCQQKYGDLLHNGYTKGNPLQQTLAGLYGSEDHAVTLATRLAYKRPRKALLEEARARARQKIVDKYAKQEVAAVKERFAQEAKQQAADFEVLRLELVEKHGTKESRWETLWDPDKDQPFFLREGEDGGHERHPKGTAICEKCDEVIPHDDSRCFNCNTDRSAKNKKLHKRIK